jgi:hypothetical protein
MAHSSWPILLIFGLLAPTGLQAADWQPMGLSDIGQHLIDKNTIAWDADRSAFSIATKVIQKDGAEWITTLRVDCKAQTFAYLNGSESRGGEVIMHFEQPRPAEKIQPQSMPYQLGEDYCDELKPHAEPDWQLLGTSKVSDVFFDQSKVRTNQEGTRFTADTRVVPFDKREETFSSMSFDCSKRTFTVMKMSRLTDGELEHIFDKPQPPASIDKTETLVKLADKYCAASKDCTEVFTKLKSIESAMQASYENDNLSCKEVKRSVQQLQELAQAVKKHHCPITSLDGYVQQLKQAECH